MTTPKPISQQIPTSSKDRASKAPIPNGLLAYFRARLSNRIHDMVLSEFAERENEGQLNRAELARRIRRKPEQITRWLGSPGNWTLDTVSDLLLGMGLEPTLSARSVPGTKELATTSGTASTVVFGVPIDMQTPEEVIQDFIEGNHKAMYFSLKTSPSESGFLSIEQIPQQTFLSIPHTPVTVLEEKSYDNQQ